MKCINLTMFLIIITITNNYLTKKTKKDDYNEDVAKKYSNLLKLLNCAKIPIQESCKQCKLTEDGSKLYYYFQSTRLLKNIYKMMIHINDKHKKVVITFSGPSITSPNYLTFIYSNRLKNIKESGFKVEVEYSRIYYRILRNLLIEKVKKILNSKEKAKYTFDFAGHSIGGSISLLAAVDLTSKGIINKNQHLPTVYSFGQTRIGDNSFIENANKNLSNVFRIVKKNDYVYRAPICYLSKKLNSWKCYKLKDMSKIRPESRLGKYINKYKNKDSHQNYRKYLHYSQKIGKLIMYNESMKNFKICEYDKEGVANCEKGINLPQSFNSAKDHFLYFQNDFEKC